MKSRTRAAVRAINVVLSDLGGRSDQQGKSRLPYGTVLGWSWVNGSRFTQSKGWVEPVLDGKLPRIPEQLVQGVGRVISALGRHGFAVPPEVSQSGPRLLRARCGRGVAHQYRSAPCGRSLP